MNAGSSMGMTSGLELRIFDEKVNQVYHHVDNVSSNSYSIDRHYIQLDYLYIYDIGQNRHPSPGISLSPCTFRVVVFSG